MTISELIKDSLKENAGKRILFFLQNGYRFEGTIIACDGDFLKYKDSKKNCIRIQKLEDIKELELR